MRGTLSVTTGVQDVVPAGKQWAFGVLHNNSDTVIYFQFTQEDTALSAANGIPLAINEKIILRPTGATVQAAIKAIHGGAGSKDLRFAFE